MKKILLRWFIVLSALYTLGHLLFGFDETRLLSAITSTIGAIFCVSVLLYMNIKEREEKIS